MHTYAEPFSENFKDFQFADMHIEVNVINKKHKTKLKKLVYYCAYIL